MSSLAPNRPLFDLRRIERETFVRQVVFRRVVKSTNDLALQLADDRDVRLPLLVLTARQTHGRGRGSNRWWSAPGSLCFSLLLDGAHVEGGLGGTASARTMRAGTGVSPGREHWPRVALTAALGVCEAVETIGPSLVTGIRWPNDVYVTDRKLCGILPEPAATQPSGTYRLVVGVGINVNNTLASAPEEVRAHAVSLSDLIGQQLSLTDVLLRVLGRLSARLHDLARCDPQLSDAWSRRCLLRGRTVELDLGTSRAAGLCRGIDGHGALMLERGSTTSRFFGGGIARVSGQDAAVPKVATG
jgi:BirA family biotin operon repressor/biotin-[acetyl-CoA-carboxylase] ligase